MFLLFQSSFRLSEKNKKDKKRKVLTPVSATPTHMLRICVNSRFFFCRSRRKRKSYQKENAGMRFRALRSATVAADGSRRLLKKAGENFIKSARNFIGARYEKKEIPADFLFLYLLIAAVDMRLEAIYYHIESDGIFSALLHDDISHSLARLHIEVMHRLDGGCILREH